MTKGNLEFHDVTYLYDTAAAPVFENITVEFPSGWTGIIGANGSGKTTLLRMACGGLSPTEGRIVTPGEVIYCPQRTDDPPADLRRFVEAIDARGCALRGQLRVGKDWADRWPSLSHGERKRAQIAVALWRLPSVLAIDEPTNHIDREARQLLSETLRAFRGVGLLVSHDRELLDGLCKRCLFLESHGATVRPGGYSKAVELAQADAARARSAYYQAKREVARLEHQAAERRHEAAQQDRKRSKRGLDKHDSDGRAKINLARVTGKDGVAGRKLRQMQGRIEQARQSLPDVHLPKKLSLGIELRGEVALRNILLDLPAGAIPLSSSRELVYPALRIGPADRIGMIGPNGAGKSTLLRHIVASLDMPGDKVIYLPQEIGRAESTRILQAVRSLPDEVLGQVMTVVSCLGSDTPRMLETDEPSPGEVRKLLLGLGMTHRPWLIVMDEPTNHLDLPSIECLEAALAECVAALLLVSHDLRFLQALTKTRWSLQAVEDDCPTLKEEDWPTTS
jgi:macrolide transport system ATP-binding/permease protein